MAHSRGIIGRWKCMMKDSRNFSKIEWLKLATQNWILVKFFKFLGITIANRCRWQSVA
jgi:hypothetical protein